MEKEYLWGSLFEDDFLYRSLGSIVSQPDIALTELVANAWDAGATEVKIFIPEKIGDILTIEDNGTGLTPDEFQQRWMKLSYNRIKYQGKKVEFPIGVNGNRYAYGKNGVGRHGLLCFDSEYKLQTAKNGVLFSCKLTTKIAGQPIAVVDKDETKCDKNEHKTRLDVVVNHNLPDVERIRNIIASRFLHDPQFRIEINRVVLPLDKLEGLIDQTVIEIEQYNIKLAVRFVDSKKAARKSIYQGIAFWQDNRLIGEPSWVLGNEIILDGRTTIAKQYTVIVSSNDLSDYIKADWSGFQKCDEIDEVYKRVSDYVNKKIEEISIDNIENTKALVKEEFKNQLKNASPIVLYEVNELIENIHISSPKAKQDAILVAVDAFINLEKSKGGIELLEKLSKLNENDIDGLNQILSKWTVKDALMVLNEIDRRLSIIEAIRKLSDDPNTDELHVLHPLITEARWLFGPEFDSSEYISNRQLQTVIKLLLKDNLIENDNINYKKRPDLVCLQDYLISTTGTETFDESNTPDISKILLIELKRGGFKIGRNERNQVVGYAENLLAHFPKSMITAYVVGKEVDTTLLPLNVGQNHGNVFVVSYARLISAAEKRLFGLRDKLSSMYDDIPGMELYKQTQIIFE